MNRNHALLISLAVGIAAIAGTVAATKTIHLGSNAAAQTMNPSMQIAQRTRALDRTKAALRKALNQRPPKLPPLPATAPGQTGRVVYVRPAPIIRTIRRAGGEREGDREARNRSEQRGGGGFDD